MMGFAGSVAAVSQATFTTDLTISELEAHFSLYCRALRTLISEDQSINQIKRSVCWRRLEHLHLCLPKRYRNPEHLYYLLK